MKNANLTDAPKETEGCVVKGFKPVLSLWALVFFGLAFVGPTAPYTFFGVGSLESQGHFALVYVIAMLAVSFTAVSYGRMATAFPEAGSTYAYASRAIHPVAGYLAGWIMLLDYLLMPMLCVIIAAVTSNKLVPSIPYIVWALSTAVAITGINLCGIEMTLTATVIFNAVLGISILWFVVAAVRALLAGTGQGTLCSIKPFYNAPEFSVRAIMSATPIAVVSFLGFDGVSTLAEDAINPKKNVARATVLVCIVAGALFILETYLGQLIWPDYHQFHPIETAFSDIGRLIGGPSLFFLIASLVVAQAWAGGITSQVSASRLMFGMARDGRLPHRLFGYVHPDSRVPVYSIVLMGLIACIGALLFDMDRSGELVNLGACLGFMTVNLSVLAHYFIRRGERRGGHFWANLVCPVLGFVICLYIMLSTSRLIMELGGLWSLAGFAYLAIQTGGFRRNLTSAVISTSSNRE